MTKSTKSVDKPKTPNQNNHGALPNPSRYQRELSWADLVLMVAAVLIGVPLLFGLTGLLMSTLAALPYVGAILRPGLVVAVVLLVAVQVLPIGRNGGYRLGVILLGASLIVWFLPLPDGVTTLGTQLEPYWFALAGCLMLLRCTDRLGCARALTVGLVLAAFVIEVYEYPPGLWSGFGFWLTIAAGGLLAATGR